MVSNVPFYLQGSQTAGLFQQPQQQLQSSIPSIGGAPQSYVPGFGMAPYAQSGITQYGNMVNGQTSMLNGQSIIPTVENGGLTKEGYLVGTTTKPGTFSSLPLGGSSSIPSTGTSGTSGPGFSIGGQDWQNQTNAWAAKVNADTASNLAQMRSGSGGGGGGGGGPSGMDPNAAAKPGGLGLNNLPSLPGNSSTPNFAQMSFSGSGSAVPYQSPNGGTYYPQGTSVPSGVQAGGGSVAMQQSNPQAGLDAYKNTPGYQLLFGNQQQQYQQSPGYQYAVNEALRQVQQNAASRGLLESGSVMRDMTDRAQQMALQDYGNWWNRQNQNYTDYQNRLAGLAGGGTGAEQALASGTGQAQNALLAGSDLASVYGNQGNAGLGSLINTGAAQSNNMTQAGNMQAQMNAANQSTLLAAALSGLF